MGKDFGDYLNSVLSVSLGVGLTLGCAYLYSRLKERRDIEERLERIEQILEEIESEGEIKDKDSQN